MNRPAEDVLRELVALAACHEAGSRLLGNLTAAEIVEAGVFMLAEVAQLREDLAEEQRVSRDMLAANEDLARELDDWKHRR